MSKQELIEKYKTKYAEEPKDWKHPSVNASRQDLFANFIRDLEQLDEPQKPVVPKFVANWYEHHKDNIEFCIQHYLRCFKFQPNDEFKAFMDDLSNKPIETLIRMKDGYEVEQEPLYRVKLGEGYFVEYQGRGALIIPDDNKEIKIFDSKSDAERTAQTIGGTVEEVAEG